MFIYILSFIILLIVSVILLNEATPEEKGRSGEQGVKNSLKRMSYFGKEGRILRNVYIPAGEDRTTEADLLFITVKGIFVVEVKNYAGYIFGSEKNKNWTVVLYAGKRFEIKRTEKHQFYNPIRQNRSHINCLKRFLDGNYKYISIVVFTDRSELKSINVDSEDTYVCSHSDLSSVIDKCWDKLPDSISEEEAERIYSALLPLTEADEEKRNKHIEQVLEAKESKKYNASGNRCPYCGGMLVLRTARKGPNAGSQFYGCSNFPDCRYTRNLI